MPPVSSQVRSEFSQRGLKNPGLLSLPGPGYLHILVLGGQRGACNRHHSEYLLTQTEFDKPSGISLKTALQQSFASGPVRGLLRGST